MLICSIDIYGDKPPYKLYELCNPGSHYIWFYYTSEEVSEEVHGKLKLFQEKIKLGDTVYLGLKAAGTDKVNVIRDGTIGELVYSADGGVYIVILMNPFMSVDKTIDSIVVSIGKASKNKLMMFTGGK